MPRDRVGPRPSTYRVSYGADVAGALRGLPGVFARLFRMGKAVAEQERAARKG